MEEKMFIFLFTAVILITAFHLRSLNLVVKKKILCWSADEQQ